MKNNSLINIGDSYLVFQIGIDDDTITSQSNSNLNIDNKLFIRSEDINNNSIVNTDYNNMLNIKIFSGNKRYDPINFQPTKSDIKFGRSIECEVNIDDFMLSRIHCSIEYKENFGWIIRDGYLNKKGFSYENNISTNGTW